MGIWSIVTLDVTVSYDDVEEARAKAIQAGRSVDNLTVPGDIDLDDALAEATVDQLREALGREEAPGYTPEQLDAIRDTFSAAFSGDCSTALALLSRIFDHPAQITAAEDGIRCACPRKAAA